MESIFHIRPFSEKWKIMKFTFSSQILKIWIYEIAHMKYRIINKSDKQYTSDGLIYTRIQNHSCIYLAPTTNFLKMGRKKVVIFHTEKKAMGIRIHTQSRQTSVYECPFHKSDRKMFV